MAVNSGAMSINSLEGRSFAFAKRVFCHYIQLLFISALSTLTTQMIQTISPIRLRKNNI